MTQNQPKILVLSHNCFSEFSANGRTLSTFFRFWDKNKVAQFFVNNEVPNSAVCNSFYRITDKDIISSILKSKKTGNQLQNVLLTKESNSKKSKETLEDKFKNLKTSSPSILYVLRNILWSTNKWDNNQLNNWVDDFQPDLILLQPGDYSFLYKMARTIAKRKNIPLVVYNSEDYYLKDKFSISPFFHLQRFFFKKEVRNTYNTADLIIYSNDLLEKNLHKYFQSKSAVILTSSEISTSNTNFKNNILRLVYAGNLGHERWKSIVTIGKAAKEINKDLVIDVYSGFLPKEATATFTIENGINFKGVVSYDEVLKVIDETDIVIHTEGFSDFTKWDIRHGFSTKIADLLSSRKCFLMYGPKKIACVDYLISNEAAWVANSEPELKEVLDKILNSEKEREKYLENAKRLVDERHDVNKNCKMFEELMIEVYQNQKKVY
jgi:glycosyltransferase involved in cell wall biosynthesis